MRIIDLEQALFLYASLNGARREAVGGFGLQDLLYIKKPGNSGIVQRSCRACLVRCMSVKLLPAEDVGEYQRRYDGGV